MAVRVTDWDTWPAYDLAECFIEGAFRRSPLHTFRAFLNHSPGSSTYPGSRLEEIAIFHNRRLVWHWFDVPLMSRLPTDRYVSRLLADLLADIEIAIQLSPVYIRYPFLIHFDNSLRKALRSGAMNQRRLTVELATKIALQYSSHLISRGLPEPTDENTPFYRTALHLIGVTPRIILALISLPFWRVLNRFRKPSPMNLASSPFMGPLPEEFLLDMARYREDAKRLQL